MKTMKIIIKVYFILSVIFSINAYHPCNNTCTIPEPIEYYWRDYYGNVPCDAIRGGTDISGNPTYIGQIFFKEYELLPATIHSGSRVATASAYNKELTSEKNIKILCSKEKQRYKWIATKNDETQALTSCHFVVGGTEVGQQLNIGRVNYENQIIIGKVFSNPLPNRGLWIPTNGHETRYLQYEILTYDCFVNSEEICDDNLPETAIRYTA